MTELIRRQDAELILAREMFATSLEGGCDPVSPMDFLPEARAWMSDAPTIGGWIPCSERLPECEQEVLICTEKKLVGKDAYIDSIVTPAIYEDGTMLEVESIWSWYDMDFDEWDDTEDCGIIPMGWFENRHFNPDEVYNNPVDRKVVAWMPLPPAYKEEIDE